MVKDFYIYIYSLSLTIFIKIYRINVRNLLIINNVDKRLRIANDTKQIFKQRKTFSH